MADGRYIRKERRMLTFDQTITLDAEISPGPLGRGYAGISGFSSGFSHGFG
jgi:hypothetical protein